MRGRRRNMFYLTGLPGWIRFGYSPGWGGPSPMQQYLATGQFPYPMGWPRAPMPSPATPMAPSGAQPMRQPFPAFSGQPYLQQLAPAPMGALDPEQERRTLESQASMLEDQLNRIRDRIEKLRD